ncbi:hypothetical protein CYOC110262_26380 [Cytobacillus oceanisediminis]|uniref:Uncharacterized protein n=1 Tax=Cytobacillus oceanisediminis TaxID=665099 RepID=A0A562JLE5_9BACI|nr:hypothetical protein [Cytobacillus oceanisediminis]TWH83988.1 hypothetical protein IQ19_03649 [Cytobacillus oceanisediminis]
MLYNPEMDVYVLVNYNIQGYLGEVSVLYSVYEVNIQIGKSRGRYCLLLSYILWGCFKGWIHKLPFGKSKYNNQHGSILITR